MPRRGDGSVPRRRRRARSQASAVVQGHQIHREQSGARHRRRFLEDRAGHRAIQALLRRPRVRSGRLYGDDDGGRRTAAL